MEDIFLLQKTLEVAQSAHDNGNLPFGCMLVDDAGNVLEKAENTVVTSGDPIAHCEINLVHAMAGKYTPEQLSRYTVYASTEPCPMCAGALYWSGVGRIVYALGKSGYHEAVGTVDPAYRFDIGAADLLQAGGRKVMIEGPLLDAEATAFYRRFGA